MRGNLYSSGRHVQVLRSIPRVRGNRDSTSGASSRYGSIPARAGGTPEDATLAVDKDGLSPRVRGNPADMMKLTNPHRSIPARAGEPGLYFGRIQPLWVYPRACGGTPEDATLAVDKDGLSPRVRGNPADMMKLTNPHRSIPARAGEPIDPQFFSVDDGVYPRACGGTGYSASMVGATWGLSPRVRGTP